ncbi:hypothetical protein [Actinomadura rubrisoli]|uniref:Uncharacterized protein n=1 Tax=Actinomadura rubrisoli TaxID=2530368 RepID=A0A4R5CDI3_9ACTN|nr:hypothetical protein [Actinomadura rubrisoli]TDD97565.1 hypothetical protein E1298_00615 [Actinomadura rubrisoli]
MGDSTAPMESRPWYRPGMSARDIACWEAAERCAAAAPEIRRGDDVWLALRPLVGGMCAHPDEQEHRAA